MVASFRGWLRQQRAREDYVGDLAYEIGRDRCLPKAARSFFEVFRHIEGAHPYARVEVWEALRMAASEYERRC